MLRLFTSMTDSNYLIQAVEMMADADLEDDRDAKQDTIRSEVPIISQFS